MRRRKASRRPGCPFATKQALAVAILLFVGAFRVGFASTVIPLGLDETTRAAGIIFAGTVERIEYDTVSGAGIVSKITFGHLVYVKQLTQGPRITLTVRGGIRGNQITTVDDLPRFEKGSRYVVFADDLGSAKNSYLPIIGLYQGVFRVQSVAGAGQGQVSDWGGRPLTAVEGGRVDVVDAKFVPSVPPPKSMAKKIPFAQPIDTPSGIPNMPPGGTVVGASEASWSDSERDSVLRSPQTVLGVSDQPVKRIYPGKSDPGTRISEPAFLAIVRAIAAEH